MLVDRHIVTTRKLLREKLRREHGNKELAQAWSEYQKTHGGRPKVAVDIKRIWKEVKPHGKNIPRRARTR